jgi:adenylate kinase
MVLKQIALTSWLKRNSDEMRKISNTNSRDIQDQGMKTAETKGNTISLHSMAKYYERIIWGHWSGEQSRHPLRNM